MNTRLVRFVPLVAVVPMLVVPIASSAVTKPTLTLAHNGTASTTGSLTAMDSGSAWTPTNCSYTGTPSQSHVVPNEGQCDIVPVKLVMPKGLPPDFKVGITGTLTYPQTVPQPVGGEAIQMCLFQGDNEAAYACGGGAAKWDDPAVGTLIVTPLVKTVNVVIDQRIGVQNTYKLTLAWHDLSVLTKISAVVHRVGSTSTITAKLLDAKGKPVKKQSLQLHSGATTIATATTSSKGIAMFKAVKPGLRLTIVFPGADPYASSSKAIRS